MSIAKAEHFDGHISAGKFWGAGGMFRSDSMDISNDPRFMAPNVILTRMGAFHLISVSAVLLGCLSCKMMLQMETDEFVNWGHYATFVFLSCSFVCDLFCVIVIVQQLFHITRLVTAGPHGFELAQAYYLNHNVVSLRQFAVRMYFISVPVFMCSTAYSIVVKLGQHTEQYMYSVPVASVMGIVGILVYVIIEKHRRLFLEKYTIAKAHEEPLMGHLRNLEKNNTGHDI